MVNITEDVKKIKAIMLSIQNDLEPQIYANSLWYDTERLKEAVKELLVMFMSDKKEPDAFVFEATRWEFTEDGYLYLYLNKDLVHVINMALVIFIEIGELSENKD